MDEEIVKAIEKVEELLKLNKDMSNDKECEYVERLNAARKCIKSILPEEENKKFQEMFNDVVIIFEGTRSLAISYARCGFPITLPNLLVERQLNFKGTFIKLYYITLPSKKYVMVYEAVSTIIDKRIVKEFIETYGKGIDHDNLSNPVYFRYISRIKQSEVYLPSFDWEVEKKEIHKRKRNS